MNSLRSILRDFFLQIVEQFSEAKFSFKFTYGGITTSMIQVPNEDVEEVVRGYLPVIG